MKAKDTTISKRIGIRLKYYFQVDKKMLKTEMRLLNVFTFVRFIEFLLSAEN